MRPQNPQVNTNPFKKFIILKKNLILDNISNVIEEKNKDNPSDSGSDANKLKNILYKLLEYISILTVYKQQLEYNQHVLNSLVKNIPYILNLKFLGMLVFI